MNTLELSAHVRGESRFIGDLPLPAGTLHLAVLGSPHAHAHLLKLDLAAARAMPGVAGVFTAADIPGENQIGGILPDEPLLASDRVHCVGQPLAIVAATTRHQARAAVRRIQATYESLPAIFDPREAFARGELIAPPRQFVIGNPDDAWSRCATVVEGRTETGAQEHLYLETQNALAVPGEAGMLKIVSSTQSPTAVQRAVARVLGVGMHQIEVDVPRLGGGFGGKEDQATPWAVMAALVAHRTGRAARIELDRRDDMRMTGKRHPYSADFKLGLDADGRIQAYEVRFFQNAGCAADLSTAVLERTLFHATGAYAVPHARIWAASCRTNLPPNTAFRGFGAPQAMFVMETALRRAAAVTGLPVAELQARNLVSDGTRMPYGMRLREPRARDCWRLAEARFDWPARQAEIAAFNASQRWLKRGGALMPICFGISFTTIFLNQASALVHIYTDGSVSVSTAAVEMGQGVNAKIAAVVAATLGIPPERVRVASTNTARVANTSPTAASTGADLNGEAARLACLELQRRLRAVEADLRAGNPGLPAPEWPALVAEAYRRRVSLSAQAHYATPGLHFDKLREQGEPFFYHVYGVAWIETTLDVRRGVYRVDRVQVVHDAGRMLDERIDRGQVEGAALQGIGWLTMEEIVHGPEGRLLSDSLTTYKVPDALSAPTLFETVFLNIPNPVGLLQSKAVGEPPFMYGIGAFFALRAAIEAANPAAAVTPCEAPLTPERVLRLLCKGDPEEAFD